MHRNRIQFLIYNKSRCGSLFSLFHLRQETVVNPLSLLYSSPAGFVSQRCSTDHIKRCFGTGTVCLTRRDQITNVHLTISSIERIPIWNYDITYPRQQQSLRLQDKHHQYVVPGQHRSYTSKKRRNHEKKGKECPFKVLGVTEQDTYAVIKRTFLKLAMIHHPDTNNAATIEEEKKHREIFVAALKAFESIVEGPNGSAILRSESDKHQAEDDFDTWFKNETGHDMPYMDAKTMKEVAEMTELIGGGLDRDGGMWTLARMVTESVKSGGDGKDALRLEAGTIQDPNINGILRRRRKR